MPEDTISKSGVLWKVPGEVLKLRKGESEVNGLRRTDSG